MALKRTAPSIPSRSVGTAPPPTEEKLVDTATLVRGRTYIFRNIQFMAGVETIVTDSKILDELEELTHETTDGEETLVRNIFLVKRDVRPPKTQADPDSVNNRPRRFIRAA